VVSHPSHSAPEAAAWLAAENAVKSSSLETFLVKGFINGQAQSERSFQCHKHGFTSMQVAVRLTTPGGGATACPVTIAYETTNGTATVGATMFAPAAL
jgi:hypothetical protein